MLRNIKPITTSLRFFSLRSHPITASSKVILPLLTNFNNNFHINNPNTSTSIINPLYNHEQIIPAGNPTSIINEITKPEQVEPQPVHEIYMDSVLRKRRLKMKKHKLRKRRRTQRALKKRLGKL